MRRGLVHPAALAAGLGPDLLDRLPEAERAVGDREFRPDRQPAPLQVEQQLAPGLRALAHPVDQADQLLPAFRRRADDDQQALRRVLQPGLHVNAVGPEVDVAPGRQIALQPARVLVRPGAFQPRDGRSREAAGVRPEQSRQRLREVARGDALEVENRDQHFEALRSARVRRQDRGAETDALPVRAAAVAHTWRTHADRADSRRDLALGQVTVAHQASAAVLGEHVGVAPDQGRSLRFDGVSQHGTGPAAQHLGERIGKRPWLGQLENVTLGHGVSLLQWRSGGSNTPTIRRLTPYTPSPRFGNSSSIGVSALVLRRGCNMVGLI